jgi:mannose-1-phosphate guanylyltransferase/phosphomannomutase
MKSIILSAGKGTRMGGLSKDIPKVMLNIGEKPILYHQIENLKKHDVKEVCINTHYLPEKIRDYFKNGEKFGVKIYYSYEPELLGTSGALNNFKDILNETFIVVYGDVFNFVNFSDMHKFHKEKGSLATLAVRKTDHPFDSDIVQLYKDGRIKSVVHKPGNLNFGDIGNVAIYILEPEIFKYLPKGESDFIKEIFPKMIKKCERLYGYNIKEFAKDVGTPERLNQVQQYLKTQHIKV